MFNIPAKKAKKHLSVEASNRANTPLMLETRRHNFAMYRIKGVIAQLNNLSREYPMYLISLDNIEMELLKIKKRINSVYLLYKVAHPPKRYRKRVRS